MQCVIVKTTVYEFFTQVYLLGAVFWWTHFIISFVFSVFCQLCNAKESKEGWLQFPWSVSPRGSSPLLIAHGASPIPCLSLLIGSFFHISWGLQFIIWCPILHFISIRCEIKFLETEKMGFIWGAVFERNWDSYFIGFRLSDIEWTNRKLMF